MLFLHINKIRILQNHFAKKHQGCDPLSSIYRVLSCHILIIAFCPRPTFCSPKPCIFAPIPESFPITPLSLSSKWYTHHPIPSFSLISPPLAFGHQGYSQYLSVRFGKQPDLGMLLGLFRWCLHSDEHRAHPHIDNSLLKLIRERAAK